MMQGKNAGADALVAEADRLALSINSEQAEKLFAFVSNVERWGKRLNLTGQPDVATLIVRQLPDALVLAAMIEELRPAPVGALDAGAGAGLVGVPLLILRPELRLALVESNRRKCAFLRAVLHKLALSATIHQARLEELSLPPQELLLSRATWPPAVWIEIGAPLLAPGGRLVCFLAHEESPPAGALEPELLRDYQLCDGTPRRVLVLR